MHLLHDPVGPGAGRVLSLRQGPPRGARAVTHPGAHLLRHSAPLAAACGGARTCRPEEKLRHRAEPQYGDRHPDALLHPAQFPLGLQARGLQDAFLRAVSHPPRRHLHQPRPRLRGAGADGARRQAVDLARRFGRRLPRGYAFERRRDTPLQGGRLHAGPGGGRGDTPRGAGRHQDAYPQERDVQLGQPHHHPRAAPRTGREGRLDRDARADGGGARRHERGPCQIRNRK